MWKEVEKGMAGVGGGKENSREKVVHCSEGAAYWWRSAGGSILIFSDSYIICHKSIVKYLPRNIPKAIGSKKFTVFMY